MLLCCVAVSSIFACMSVGFANWLGGAPSNGDDRKYPIAYGIPATVLTMWTEWPDPGAAIFRIYAPRIDEKSDPKGTRMRKNRGPWGCVGGSWSPVGPKANPAAFPDAKTTFVGHPLGRFFEKHNLHFFLHCVCCFFDDASKAAFLGFVHNSEHIFEDIWCAVWRRLDIVIFATFLMKRHCF